MAVHQLHLSTRAGNLVIKDIVRAIDKDTRTLFASDNYKNDKKPKQHTTIPELHLLSYYGDITGPNELQLRNNCNNLIKTYLKTWQIQFKSNDQQFSAKSLIFCQSLFEESTIEIMHISHYSFEFVLNVNITQFSDVISNEYTYNRSVNNYLVGTYQQSGYDNIDEFITIGITKSISHSNNSQLYNFYVDDFIQDLYKILHNTLWYDQSCELPLLLWYDIAKYSMDCILPVTYTRSNYDEITLNNGSLHLFLTGDLNPFDSGDTKEDDELKKMDERLEIISQIFMNLGRIIFKQYNSNKHKMKSEYDKWKKQGFKKRVNIKPSNIKDLSVKLRFHQQTRSQANDRESVNELKHLYYTNPNFKVKFSNKKKKSKHRKPKTTMQSLKNFFSFGSSLNPKKNKSIHSKTQSANPLHLITSETDEVMQDFVVLRAKTEPTELNQLANKRTKTNKKRVKKTDKKPYTKKNDTTLQMPMSKSMSRSKSAGNPNKNKKLNNSKYMTINMLYNAPLYDTMDDDDKILLPDTNIAETHSADSVYMMKKPQKGKPGDIQNNSPYSHDENVVTYLDYDQKESGTTSKIRADIIKAYKDYRNDKGKTPNHDDIQSFVTYCKTRKNIKKANWTLCQSVTNQMENIVE